MIAHIHLDVNRFLKNIADNEVCAMRKTNKSVVDDTIVRRMLLVMESKNIRQQELVEYLGLANGIFTHWKYDGSKTYMRYLDKIADFLGVSKNYLVEGRDQSINEDTITTFEVEVLQMLRDMDDSKRELSYQTIKMLWNDTKKIKEMSLLCM